MSCGGTAVQEMHADLGELFSSLGMDAEVARELVGQLCTAVEETVREFEDGMRFISDSIQYLSLFSFEHRLAALCDLGFSPKAMEVFSRGKQEGWFDAEALSSHGVFITPGDPGLREDCGIWMVLTTQEQADAEGFEIVLTSRTGLFERNRGRFGPECFSGVKVAKASTLRVDSTSGVGLEEKDLERATVIEPETRAESVPDPISSVEHGSTEEASEVGQVGVAASVFVDINGYCYHSIVEPQHRLTVADALGPRPDFRDVLRLEDYVVLPVSQLLHKKGRLNYGVAHVGDEGDLSFQSLVRAFVGEAVMDYPLWVRDLCLASRDRDVVDLVTVHERTILAGDTIPAGRVKLTLIKGGKGKATCSHCKKVVDPVGHPDTCPMRPRTGVLGQGSSVDESKEARVALVGDAMHTLDVRVLIAGFSKDETKMSIDAVRYTSAVAQRRYLEKLNPGLLDAGRSDHAWGTAFEVRYSGTFRRVYLRWLVSDMSIGRKAGLSDVLVMAKSYSSLMAQVLLEVSGE